MKAVPRYTVLTYITGDYERVHEVKEKSPHARYILVTDREELKSETWEVICDKTLFGSPMNKTRYVKWHPWKYTDDEVVLMIDGSIGVNGPLDEIIAAFQGYNLCMMIHPERNTVKSELEAWIDWRGLSPDDAERQLSLMEMAGYGLNSYRGLYQCCFKIMRRTRLVEMWMETVAGLLMLCGKRGEFATPEQVLASFALNKFFNKIPVMWVSQRIFGRGSLSWHFHNSDDVIRQTDLIEPYAFDHPVEVYI